MHTIIYHEHTTSSTQSRCKCYPIKIDESILKQHTIDIVGVQHLKQQADGVRFNLSNVKITDEQISRIYFNESDTVLLQQQGTDSM